MTAAARPVVAVVPIKALALAKSRLTLPDGQRRALTVGFALDTIAALLRSPLVLGVLVVTSDPDVTRRVLQPAVRVTPDAGVGLDQAVRLGIAAANEWWPGHGVAVVPADLPCLRPRDVTEVLVRASATGATFVRDRSGGGTTLVVAPAGAAPVTGYGPASAARHLSLGLRPLEDAPVRARQDVDTLEDVRAARLLGCGPRTTAVLDAFDLGGRLGAFDDADRAEQHAG